MSFIVAVLDLDELDHSNYTLISKCKGWNFDKVLWYRVL